MKHNLHRRKRFSKHPVLTDQPHTFMQQSSLVTSWQIVGILIASGSSASCSNIGRRSAENRQCSRQHCFLSWKLSSLDLIRLGKPFIWQTGTLCTQRASLSSLQGAPNKLLPRYRKTVLAARDTESKKLVGQPTERERILGIKLFKRLLYHSHILVHSFLNKQFEFWKCTLKFWLLWAEGILNFLN